MKTSSLLGNAPDVEARLASGRVARYLRLSGPAALFVVESVVEAKTVRLSSGQFTIEPIGTNSRLPVR